MSKGENNGQDLRAMCRIRRTRWGPSSCLQHSLFDILRFLGERGQEEVGGAKSSRPTGMGSRFRKALSSDRCTRDRLAGGFWWAAKI